jgi:cytoskeleton protein RodZ
MASAGNCLHELRERHGVALEEIAQATRISPRFLEALEADDFAALPAGPFVKGFIRSYCQALGESAEQPLALYAAATTANPPRRETAAPPRRKRSLAPVLVSLVLLVILGAALAAVTIALRSGRGDGGAPRGSTPGVGDQRDARAPEPSTFPAPGRADAESSPMASEAEATSRRAPTTAPSARSAASAVEVPSNRSAPMEPERALPSTVASRSPYRLVARASDATWIRVRMEGGRTTEETIPAGDTREWISNHPFELQVGNAGGISLELNGQALPPLGARGAVIPRLVVPADPR